MGRTRQMDKEDGRQGRGPEFVSLKEHEMHMTTVYNLNIHFISEKKG